MKTGSSVRMGMFDYYRPTNTLECPICRVPLTEWLGGDGPCALLVWQQGIAAPIGQTTEEENKLAPSRREQFRLPPKFWICSYDCEVHCVKAECTAPDGTWAEVRISEASDLKSMLLANAAEEETPSTQPPDPEVIVEEIDHLLMEINSGASFEQYFVWTPVEQISRVVRYLELVGLSEVAELTRAAVQIAFPNGLPGSDEERERQVAQLDEVQTTKLIEFARSFTEHNERITDVLASYAHNTGN